MCLSIVCVCRLYVFVDCMCLSIVTIHIYLSIFPSIHTSHSRSFPLSLSLSPSSLLAEGHSCHNWSPGCPGRRVSSSLQRIRDDVELAGRQLLCQYDNQLSEEYGGIPLMRRDILGHSGIEGKLASMILFPEWTTAFVASFDATRALSEAWDKLHPSMTNITDMRQYDELYNFFMNHYEDYVPKKMKQRYEFWTRDNLTDPFLTINKTWNDDLVFAQTRLMGVNPVQIECVTPDNSKVGYRLSDLMPMLNSTGFNWDKAVENATGITKMAKVREG